MKLAISNIAWNNEMDDQIYRHMKELSFSGLEIAPTRIVKENPYEEKGIVLAKGILSQLRHKYGFEICSMQSILFEVKDRIFYGKEERQRLLLQVKKAIYYAGQIGCKNLVFGCPSNRGILDVKEQYPLAIAFFRELGQYAEENDVVLALEANPVIYNTNFINTTQEAINLIRRVDVKGFQLNLDMGTIICNEEKLENIESNSDCIHHIHISEPYLLKIKPRIEYKKLFEFINKIKYDKFISIEMRLQENITDVLDTMSYIRHIADNLFV